MCSPPIFFHSPLPLSLRYFFPPAPGVRPQPSLPRGAALLPIPIPPPAPSHGGCAGPPPRPPPSSRALPWQRRLALRPILPPPTPSTLLPPPPVAAAVAEACAAAGSVQGMADLQWPALCSLILPLPATSHDGAQALWGSGGRSAGGRGGAQDGAHHGVSRGLGWALALELARRGYAVVGCGRSAEHLRSLEAEITSPSRHFLTIAKVVRLYCSSNY
ncbi:hypothetical protein PVAP13_8KG169605 [Panicum virgatum]|uniref:Uncharacterized protein n=1 Tax=Panicum virgatum TaxID=38727 RepID=A0A8T0PH45_PANVG|nr:hypothetical protein PVAP13_8KG169605 [Panicum virgatum]